MYGLVFKLLTLFYLKNYKRCNFVVFLYCFKQGLQLELGGGGGGDSIGGTSSTPLTLYVGNYTFCALLLEESTQEDITDVDLYGDLDLDVNKQISFEEV